MYRIGIDLGGTNIAAGVVDENHKIIASASVKANCPRPAEEIADSIAEVARIAVKKAGISWQEVDSVGVGTPGAVNQDGVVENSANLGFLNTPLKDMVKARLRKPAFIENDANCAALGEQIAGRGHGVPNFIFITLGTGIGGGIILDGKLLTGINGAAGEIGHMVIVKDGVPCNCGRHGCFEKYASATALVRETKEAMEADAYKTSLMWTISDNLDKVNGMTSFKAARQGDALGLEVVDEYISYLAVGVTDLINIFQPDMVCIGGGISREGDFLIRPLTEKVMAEQYAGHAKRRTEICAAVLGNDAGIIGAALLATL
ncbi:MAG TPA: ROK family glucokinase [Clostridiales bacterium]|nr:ROK family glucokinase [Clostridiales bacterium]